MGPLKTGKGIALTYTIYRSEPMAALCLEVETVGKGVSYAFLGGSVGEEVEHPHTGKGKVRNVQACHLVQKQES